MNKVYVRKYDYDENWTPMYAIIVWDTKRYTCWNLIHGSETPDKQKRDYMFQNIKSKNTIRDGHRIITNEPPPNMCDIVWTEYEDERYPTTIME